ncbi:MAG: hypothetical protein Q4F57_00020 [Weeksellaceae bacterium]|nr:hypothetical protein [Weeksellaceae bacterium]
MKTLLPLLLFVAFAQFLILPGVCAMYDAKAEYVFFSSAGSEEESHSGKNAAEEQMHILHQVLWHLQSDFLSDSTQAFLVSQVLSDYEVSLSLFVPPPEV